MRNPYRDEGCRDCQVPAATRTHLPRADGLPSLGFDGVKLNIMHRTRTVLCRMHLSLAGPAAVVSAPKGELMLEDALLFF